MKKQRIAIIGGGISGLAMAYQLLTQESDFDFIIDIYEASDFLGGNADTAKVDLGEVKDVLLANSRQENTGHLLRTADLGVDDINLDTYTNIVEIMQKIGFTDIRPLEDTACFFTLDGSKVLTADSDLHHGTSDPETAISQELSETYTDFMKSAASALINEFEKYKSYTVGQFVDEYKKPKNDLTLFKEMRDCLLYPRINAMYFADDVTGPEGMPLRSVMLYYTTQEGFNPKEPPKPKRNYFIHGAQSWIDALAKYLDDKYGSEDKSKAKFNVIKNAQANVFIEKTKVLVSVPPKQGTEGLPKPQTYDKVIVTCHADDAMRAIKKGLTQELTNVLDKVRYTNSIAVAHTFAGVLPPNRNSWRTYNVLIREGQAIRPYSMTYVMNRHQNDAATWVEKDKEGNPVYQTTKYNKAGMPQYFVTLNPAVPIPDEYVLKTPKGEPRKPAGYFKQFQPNEEVLPGWRMLGGAEGEEQPVIGWFKHNVLNFDCLDAQEQLEDLQGGEFLNLYFAGGWTYGAGLHEECWIMAKKVTEMLIKHENFLQGKQSNSEQPETTC